MGRDTMDVAFVVPRRGPADSDRGTFDKLKAASATPGVVAGNDVLIAEKESAVADLGGRLKVLLLPKDPLDEKNVVLEITDTGVGIDPAILPRVFDTFTQGDSSLDRGQGGLGLGLTLVKGLAELHGGRAEHGAERAGDGERDGEGGAGRVRGRDGLVDVLRGGLGGDLCAPLPGSGVHTPDWCCCHRGFLQGCRASRCPRPGCHEPFTVRRICCHSPGAFDMLNAVPDDESPGTVETISCRT